MIPGEARASGPEESHGEDAVIDVGLLLGAAQLTALESAAHIRGLTAAGLIRYLIGEFLHGPIPGPTRAIADAGPFTETGRR